MKNSYVSWIILSLAIMIIPPWIAVTFIRSDAGMAVVFLLFYAIDPLYSAIAGYFAGKDIRKMLNIMHGYLKKIILKIIQL